jgi:hypothetical protein
LKPGWLVQTIIIIPKRESIAEFKWVVSSGERREALLG